LKGSGEFLDLRASNCFPYHSLYASQPKRAAMPNQLIALIDAALEAA